ncbi:hypothetical protein SKAU_G00338630 [Synaphobranchus kaupii]|uniref:Integrase catalytic domain-containing protein n=1 Tax=Synaphobranchus kaupii TaxID=118154 RepID=A0A9Q1EMQ6_SYNKA|nr:hypothetical protein SKAU_G00338630 [Synaphobranchus kaupii]
MAALKGSGGCSLCSQGGRIQGQSPQSAAGAAGSDLFRANHWNTWGALTQERTQALRLLPQPTTVTGLRQAMGLANYCRLYVPDFGELVVAADMVVARNEMKQDIYDYTSRCLICLETKNHTTRKKIPMGCAPRPKGPWTHLQMDFTGPLPPSGGYMYLFVVIDQYTRWVEVFPTRNCTAATAARLLATEIFPRWGLPYQIHSDNGTHFTERAGSPDQGRTTRKAEPRCEHGVTPYQHRVLQLKAQLYRAVLQIEEGDSSEKLQGDSVQGAVVLRIRPVRAWYDKRSSMHICVLGHLVKISLFPFPFPPEDDVREPTSAQLHFVFAGRGD